MSDVKAAGFWRRVSALSVDTVLVIPIYWLCKQLDGMWVQEAVFFGIMIAFYAFFLSSNWRATPGMRMLKVQAVGADGQALSKLHAAAWCVVSSVFFVMILAPMIYMMWWMHTYQVDIMLAAVNSGQITHEMFNMELMARTGINAEQMIGVYTACLAVTVVLGLIWALSIALSKRKVGWHNWLSATRFVVRNGA